MLALEALAWFEDRDTLERILSLSQGPADAVREVAWRTLARRRDAPAERRVAMIRVLAEARDAAAALAALDALLPAAHPDLKPIVERHAASLEPAVQSAAVHFLARVAATEEGAKPGGGGPPPDRYAPPGGPPEPPPPDAPPRARYDFVYALDVTGSTVATLPGLKTKVLDEVALLDRLGASVRVGMVAFRDGPRGGDLAAFEILPPTFDRPRLEAFVRALEPRGVDASGAAIASALHEALDRTPWRWDAVRQVQLYADTGLDDARAAGETVEAHYRADATRTRVAFALRTRGVVPPGLADLARRGGTGTVELLR
jgi:hypothetical protein